MTYQRRISLKHVAKHIQTLFTNDIEEKPRDAVKSRNLRAVLEVNRYRTAYDLIAQILALKHGLLYASMIIDEIGISARRAYPLIHFMEDRGLIERTYLPVLETPNAYSVRKRWKVTHKGELYLKRYNGLLHLMNSNNSLSLKTREFQSSYVQNLNGSSI